MKKWGLLITVYYAIAVAALFWPLFWILYMTHYNHGTLSRKTYVETFWQTVSYPWFVVPMAVVILGQILLLVISVDTSQRRLRPRARLVLPVALTGLFLSVLGSGILTSILLVVFKDNFFDYLDQHHAVRNSYLILWPVLWLVWSLIFYLRARDEENPVARAASWVLKGSILEFLIVVPSHIIVRRRDDCCAPIGTSLGLCCGLAIMIVAFGPSVLLLYKKQMEKYKIRPAQKS